MSHFEYSSASSRLCKEAYTKLRRKDIIDKLNYGLPGILEENRLKCIGITLTHNSFSCTQEEAWRTIGEQITRTHAILEDLSDVVFILSAIEIHEGSKKPRRFKPKIPVNLTNKDFYKEESERIRKDRVLRDEVEDLIKEEYPGDEGALREGLYLFDQDHGFIATRRSTSNGRSLILDANTRFPIEWNWPQDKVGERYYIVKEIDNSNDDEYSLTGYPHIHLAIGFMSLRGRFRDPRELHSLLLEVMPDIQIGTKKGKAVNFDHPPALVGYILKNTRHSTVRELLEATGYGDKHAIFNCKQAPMELVRFFKEIVLMRCPLTFINERQQVIEPYSKKYTAKRGGNQFREACDIVIFAMEKYQLAMANGWLYQKDPDSKQTWMPWKNNSNYSGSARCFIGTLLSPENDIIIQHRSKIEETLTTPGQSIFPTITLDCQWVEFADCFMFIGGGIITNRTHRPCFVRFSEITRSMLEDGTDLTPKRFLQIIQNSFPDQATAKELLQSLFKLYLPRIHKDPVLYMVGEPNSGKTTLIDSIARMYPEDRVMRLCESKFSLADITGKYLLILDEGIGIESLGDKVLLKLLEGDSTLSIDSKHKDAATRKVNINLIIASNRDLFRSSLDVEEPSAFDTRLIRFNFKTLVDRVPGGKQSVMIEQARILLYLAKSYFGELTFNDNENSVKKIYADWRRLHKKDIDELEPLDTRSL